MLYTQPPSTSTIIKTKTMARLLSQTLTKTTYFSTPFQLLKLFSSNQFPSNHFSTRSSSSIKKPQSTDESKSEIDVDVLALKKLDDFVHNVIVKQCEPDWLPFVPGMSYWVPPRRDVTKEVFDVFKTLTNPLTVGGCLDESMAVVTARAWPSSDFFIQGTSPMRPVEVNVDENDDNMSQPEDKEG